jgi:peptidoglycan/xylan/chitin deacetylase (PgdA/CDA1 family)
VALSPPDAGVRTASPHRDDGVRAPMFDGSTRTLLGLLSPAGARARLSILIFHRVHAQPDALFPFEMHARAFLERMVWIRSWFNVMPLDVAVTRLASGTLPARALAITFDDGYADNFTVALPILRQLELHATFFVASAFIDGGRMWNDTLIEAVRGAIGDVLDLSTLDLGVHSIASPQLRARAIGELLPQLKYLAPSLRQARVDAIASLARACIRTDMMMTSVQLRGLVAAGMTIGAHTQTHPILTRLDAAAARREIADGRDALAAMTGQPVNLFAYPNGKPDVDYAVSHVRIVRELGFAAAVSTAAGAARGPEVLLELPRFTPWGGTPTRWSAGLARNLIAGTVRAAE